MLTQMLSDPARKLALLKTGLLDSLPEESFDRITRLTSRLLNCPVVLVSLVTEDRQFFKSQVGLPEPWKTSRQTPLDHSLCQFVVRSEKAFIVEDAGADQKLCTHPAVLNLKVAAYIGMPLRTASGHVLGALCAIDFKPHRWTADDISTLQDLADVTSSKIELRSITAEYRESEDRFKAFMDHCPAMAYIVDAGGVLLHANRAMHKRFGPEVQNWIGHPPTQRWKAPDAERAIQSVTVAIEHGYYEREEMMTSPSGVTTWWLTYKFPLKQSDGQTVVGGMSIEITARKQSEEKLRESEERLRLATDAGQIATSVRDFKTDLLHVSPRFCEIFGLPATDSVPVSDLMMASIHPEDRLPLIKALEAAHSPDGTGLLHVELRIIRNGQTRWVVHNGRTKFEDTPSGRRAVYGFGATVDITDQKQNEQNLIEAKTAAEAASKAKSLFLAQMNHEIRTPLTGILGYADLLLNSELPEDRRRDYLHTIRRNGEHLLALIDDILDMTRIEADKVEVEKISVDLPRLISDVARLFTTRALDKKLRFEAALASPIPAIIHTDPTRLRQILINLVSNAIKFTNAGRVDLIASVVDAPDNRAFLTFEVRDTGIGMVQDRLQKLFLPFEQGDPSHTRLYGGAGLGLAISQRLASLLGGRLMVQSQLGTGSAFTLELPIDAESPRDVVRLTDDQTPAPPVRERQVLALSGRVLLAEDSLDTQRLLRVYLEQAGAEVELAENGLLAIEKTLAAMNTKKPFGLVLMDVQMPVMDGIDATQKLRQAGYALPIVMLTANATRQERDRCMAAGCDDFLNKPIHVGTFLSVVERHLSKPSAKAADSLIPLRSELAADSAVAPLIQEFLRELADKASRIRESLDRGALDEVGRIAHQIKGSAGQYGYPTITAAAKRVSDALDNSQAAARPEITQLLELIHRATSTVST